MNIKSRISSIFRPLRNKRRQNYFFRKYGKVEGNYTILSNNCIGGMCYHDANKQFLSPTINLVVDNFLTFVLNMKKYIFSDIEEVENDTSDYPVGVLKPQGELPPVKISFVHYNSFDEAKEKWVLRCQRMLSEEGRLCIIYCVPSGKILDEEEMNKFLKIKAYRKLCFYRNANIELPDKTETTCFVMIPKKYQSLDYSKYTGLFSRKRYFDYFFDIFPFLFK